MTDLAALAARMYGGTPAAAAPAASAEPAAPAEPAPAPAVVSNTIEAEPVSEDLGSGLFSDDGDVPSDGSYAPAIGSVFDDLEREVREDQDKAEDDREYSAEDLHALSEGRKLVESTLAELGVGASGAREVSLAVTQYRQNPLSDEAFQQRDAQSVEQLRQLWGRSYDENARFANLAFIELCKRIPFLEDELNAGARVDVKVIRQLASMGRKIARRTAKK